ncbi:MAG TPA: hypothetical protein VJ974_08810 [Geopsychrobacteraceae bacterium]|nr:hypothetical protein [Geopsychrobacteraceae bacterium]
MQRTAQLITYLCFILIFFIPLTCLAESTGADAPAGDSIDRLAKAVENLNRILEKQSDATSEDKDLRKLDIAISYLNFRSRRIELMERDLNMAKNERIRYQDSIEAWKERLELVSREMEGKSQQELQELEQRRLELELRIKSFEQRTTNISEEIIIQENQISELMSDLDSVESYIQQHLNL